MLAMHTEHIKQIKRAGTIPANTKFVLFERTITEILLKERIDYV